MQKVLVVDDDSDLLDSIKSILEEEGYSTKVVSKWEKVYSLVREFQPDLILLDIQLQGMDGRIICRGLKSAEDTRHIPIIIISSYSFTEVEVSKYGADCFLSKPFSIKNLLGQVKQHLLSKS